MLSYGTQPGVHPTSINVGNVLTLPILPACRPTLLRGGAGRQLERRLGPKSIEVIYDAPAAQNQPPVLTQPANQSSVQNTAVSLTLVASDPEGSPLTYSASGLPPGLVINASTGVIRGTVTTAGTYTVTAGASDGSLTASRSFTWTVSAAQAAPPR